MTPAQFEERKPAFWEAMASLTVDQLRSIAGMLEAPAAYGEYAVEDMISSIWSRLRDMRNGEAGLRDVQQSFRSLKQLGLLS